MGQTNYIGFDNDKNDVKLLAHAKLAISVGDNPEVLQVSHEHLPAEDERHWTLSSGYAIIKA